jgi:hypothetical protein
VLVEWVLLELLEVILYFHLSLLLAVDLVARGQLMGVTGVPAGAGLAVVVLLLAAQAHLVKGLLALLVMVLQVMAVVLAAVLLLLEGLHQAGALATEGQVKPQA